MFQRPGQQCVAKHLRRLRPPEAGAWHGCGDAAIFGLTFQRIRHRRGEDAADRIGSQLRQQLVQQRLRQAGPGGIVDQHPVFRRDLGSAGAQAVQHAFRACRSAATQDGQFRKSRPVIRIPPAVLRRNHHMDADNGRMLLERTDGVPDHRLAVDGQILLGMLGAHAGTDSGGGKQCVMSGKRWQRRACKRVEVP